jgi:prepilin-type N-terminal cleavage/methylation domain-containing protein
MKKGFTLIEVLVALFIFTLVILAAYKIYDHSQKTYLLGEQLTDAQQSTRFAFEKLSHDLRIAGFRVYPDSDALRTDLPIEGMWSGAIAVRADFDEAEETGLECTKDAATGECVSGTGQFGLVTTGNRDLRVYVLAKKAGQAVEGSNETLKFRADFSAPRDAFIGDPGTLETVVIPGVSLNQDKPPYKLYMVTFLEEGDDGYAAVPDGGEVPAANLVWTPVADGIFSLSFEYYNQNGIAEANLVDPDEADATDPDDWPLFRRIHGWPFGGSGAGGGNVVKNVVMNLIGMTARPDGRYTDPLVGTDTSGPRFETRMHRKYELSTTLNLLNVGAAPHELADTIPPDDPSELVATLGYCGGALLSWNPVLAQDLSVYWIQVVDPGTWTAWGGSWKYNCDDAPNTCVATSNVEDYGERVGFYVRNLTNGSMYHARVFAQDAAGNFSRNPTNQIDFSVDPAPLKPLGAVVTEGAAVDVGGFQRLQVTWTPPEEYDTAQNPACIGDVDDEDGLWPMLRDLYGYRLYHRRQLTAAPVDFSATPEDLVADENNPGTNPLRAPMVQYADIKACPCEYYAYKMKSVTACTDADDDTTKSPPCVHTGDTSAISSDPDGNPVAYLAPELQDAAIFPQVVPAQPAKPGASATPTTLPDYDIVLQFPPVFTSVLKDSLGGFSANPAADQQFEVWRYRIYEYTEDPALNPSATATRIDDASTGANDYDDWDAGVDATPVVAQLTPATQIKLTINRPIPSGEKRWYAVAGLYRCDGGSGTTLYEGPQSLAVSVPCNASWTLNVTSPPMDNTIVNASGTTYSVVAKATGLSGGVTIAEMKITIAGGGVSAQPMALAHAGTTATGTFTWNLTGLPDGNYPIVVTAVDSNGCSSSASRIAAINQACGSFRLITLSPGSGNLLTWELQKVNGSEQFLLDQMQFSSSNYLTTAINFYATNPTVGSPTPLTLWTGSATDFNGKTLGANFTGSTYTYAMTNLCNADAVKRTLDLNPFAYPTATAGSSNWFRLAYDKNLIPANGPLNLFGTFSFRPCPGPTVSTFTVAKKANYTFTFPVNPVCAWEWTYVGKAPTVNTSNICNGTIVFTGAASGSADVTVKYWAPAGTLTCSNLPIFMGP